MRNSQQNFAVKIIKMNEMDHSRHEREERERLEAEQKELEERRYATGILMQHGITQAEGRIASRKAAFAHKASSNIITGIESMIAKHEYELAEFKHRLEELEMAEVGRLEKEIEKKEELFNNHGRDKDFFKAPDLHTTVRKIDRLTK